jgi:hypothetical protein
MQLGHTPEWRLEESGKGEVLLARSWARIPADIDSGGRRIELEGGGTPPKKILRHPNCEERLPNERYIRQTRV